MNFDYVSLRRLERFFTDLKDWLSTKYTTKEELEQAIANFGGFEVVSLDQQGYPDVASPSTKVIYLTKEAGSQKTDPYTEWICTNVVGPVWEVIGETSPDINEMVGATASTAGTAGLVPAPAAGDQGKVLTGDGNWSEVEEYTNAYIDSLSWLTGPSIVVGGKEYPYVQIGNQLWLAENLKFAIPGVTLDVSPVTYDDACILSNPNTPGYAEQYGYLYTRGAAVQISSGGYLPSGWRVPTKTDIETLNSYLSNNGLVLKSSSGWYSDGNGTDDYGFNALPAGYYDGSNGGYLDITKKFQMWTTTNFGSYRGSILRLVNNSNAIMLDTSLYSCCLSIRLVKDAT